jgi:hypothetical protein
METLPIKPRDSVMIGNAAALLFEPPLSLARKFHLQFKRNLSGIHRIL